MIGEIVNPLRDWRIQIRQKEDLMRNPQAYWRRLVVLSMLAFERNQVTTEQLSEMLELTDAARLWALSELEDDVEPQRETSKGGIQRFVGGVWILEG